MVKGLQYWNGKGFWVCSTVGGNSFWVCSSTVVGKGLQVCGTLVHAKGFRVSSEKRVSGFAVQYCSGKMCPGF